MKKPREFWISEYLVDHYNLVKPATDFDHLIHVREVVPIDWEKVWEEYYSVICDEFDEPLLQQLVEKQIENGND